MKKRVDKVVGAAAAVLTPTTVLDTAFKARDIEVSKLNRLEKLSAFIKKQENIESFLSSVQSGDGKEWLHKTYNKIFHTNTTSRDSRYKGLSYHKKIHGLIKDGTLLKYKKVEFLSTVAVDYQLTSFANWFYDSSDLKDIRKCNTVFSFKYGIRGAPDAIGTDTLNNDYILEFKTGRVCPKNILQVSAYVKAHNDQYNTDIKNAQIVYILGSKYTHIRLDEDQINAAYKAYEGFKELYTYDARPTKTCYSIKIK